MKKKIPSRVTRSSSSVSSTPRGRSLSFSVLARRAVLCLIVLWTATNIVLSVYLADRTSTVHPSNANEHHITNQLDAAPLHGGKKRRGRLHVFGIADDTANKHTSTSTRNGTHKAKNEGYIPATAVLCSTVRNMQEKKFSEAIPKLRKLGSYFQKYHIVIYENNSRERYRKAYQRELSKVPNDYTFVTEDLTASEFAHPDDTGRIVEPSTFAAKTTRIAMARNKLLDIVQQGFSDEYEYMIVMDLDHGCSKGGGGDVVGPDHVGYSPSVLREAFVKHGNEFDVLTFRHDPYWDLWALRHKTQFPYNMYGPFKEKNPTQGKVKKWISKLDPAKLHEVESAFMLMAIYRISKTVGARYSGWGSMEGELEESDCEHVSFHRDMAKRNDARIRLWPVVYCQNAEGFNEQHEAMDRAIGSLKDEAKTIRGGNAISATSQAEVHGTDGELRGTLKLGANKKKKKKINADAASPQFRRKRLDSDLTQAIENIDMSMSAINMDSIIWSRNWHKVATSCPSIPQSYYDAQTAKVQKSDDLKKYFMGCTGGGIVWLRTGSARGNSDIAVFIDHVLPQITKPFILVSSDGDNSIPSQVKNAKALLESQMLTKWYTQNCDGCVKGSPGYHDKLRPIPIGLDLHSRRDYTGSGVDASSGGQQILQYLLGLRSYSRNQSRDDTVLVPPWDRRTSQERGRAEDALQCIAHEKKQGRSRFPLEEVWNFYTQHKAGLAPRGNGIDTHRVWEMLLLGMVPVVKSSPLDAMYERVPAVIVHDWADLCNGNILGEKLNALPTPSSTDEIFTMQYWIPEAKDSPRTGVTSNNRDSDEFRHIITSGQQLCEDLKSGKNYESVLINKCFDGFQGGVGNGLMEYFYAVLVALAAGFDVINGCTDETKIQALMGSDVKAKDFQPIGLTWEDACDTSSCVVPRFPGTCPNHFNKLTKLFRRDLRAVANEWQAQNSPVLDDVVVHFRCGDILTFPMSEYGFVRYHAYADAIDAAATNSIGIVTAPLDKSRCRKFDCKALDKCEALLGDLVLNLQARFPGVSVHIRNGPKESIKSSFGRMTLAKKQVICGPSTFCVLPAIATVGQAHIVQSDRLYPWVAKVAEAEPNIHLITDPFISSDIAKRMSVDDLMVKLRENS